MAVNNGARQHTVLVDVYTLDLHHEIKLAALHENKGLDVSMSLLLRTAVRVAFPDNVPAADILVQLHQFREQERLERKQTVAAS